MLPEIPGLHLDLVEMPVGIEKVPRAQTFRRPLARIGTAAVPSLIAAAMRKRERNIVAADDSVAGSVRTLFAGLLVRVRFDVLYLFLFLDSRVMGHKWCSSAMSSPMATRGPERLDRP